MDRARAETLCRGDRDLAHLMPAPDDLGRRRRPRLCRAPAECGGIAGDGYREWREIFAGAWTRSRRSWPVILILRSAERASRRMKAPLVASPFETATPRPPQGEGQVA